MSMFRKPASEIVAPGDARVRFDGEGAWINAGDLAMWIEMRPDIEHGNLVETLWAIARGQKGPFV